MGRVKGRIDERMEKEIKGGQQIESKKARRCQSRWRLSYRVVGGLQSNITALKVKISQRERLHDLE